MIKKIWLVGLLGVASHFSQAQETKIDTTALMILDKMGAVFGDLSAVGFTSKVAKDVAYTDNFFIKEFSSSKVRFVGPDKFSVRGFRGEEGRFVYL